MGSLTGYLGLFVAALVAATILPAQSEALLIGLIVTGDYPVPTLIAVASIGNVLGSLLNWCLGRALERNKGKRWFPVKEDTPTRAQGWYRRYGKCSAGELVPVIGDPITAVAGVRKEPLSMFLFLVGLRRRPDMSHSRRPPWE